MAWLLVALLQDPNELVERLGADDIEQRESAERALLDLGPRALEALRWGTDGGDAEMGARVASIRQEIERRERMKPFQGPKPVALEVSAERVSDAARRLADLFGVQTPRVPSSFADKRIDFAVKNKPFWEAFDALGAAAEGTGPGMRWELGLQRDAGVGVATDGDVRIVASATSNRRRSTLRIDVMLPPKRHVLGAQIEDAVMTDGNGVRFQLVNALRGQPEMPLRKPSAVSAATLMRANVIALPGAVTIKGTVALWVARDVAKDEVALGDEDGDSTLRLGDELVRVRTWVRSDGSWDYAVERDASLDDPMPLVVWLEQRDGTWLGDVLAGGVVTKGTVRKQIAVALVTKAEVVDVPFEIKLTLPPRP